MEGELEEQLLAILEGEANIDVEIDQDLYPKPEWAVRQIVRASGLVENICCHGVGHPHEASVKEFENIKATTESVIIGKKKIEGII